MLPASLLAQSACKIMKNFISLKELSSYTIVKLVKLAVGVKKNSLRYKSKLKGYCIGLLFEKPSLRTKTAFYLGALQLGADAVYYGPGEVNLGVREKVSDGAKVFSRYLDAVVLRTFSHSLVEEFCKFSSVPVINALSDLCHPSQALGDLLTLYELKRDLKKIKFSFVGDGNNVANSLIYALSILGGNIFVASPAGYEPSGNVLREAQKKARKSGGRIEVVNNIKDAVLDADVIYTDVWTSMGKEKEAAKRRKVFRGFQINGKALRMAKKNCVVMHCLPAHRGEEITDEVIEGRNSYVFLQAENRLYSAKAILLYVLGGKL